MHSLKYVLIQFNSSIFIQLKYIKQHNPYYKDLFAIDEQGEKTFYNSRGQVNSGIIKNEEQHE